MILVGTAKHKRTEYMKRAVGSSNMQFSLLSYEQSYEELLQQLYNYSGAVKIDPPSFYEDELQPMKEHLSEYQMFLTRLSDCQCHFLNHPSALLSLLDKCKCKKALTKHGLSTTKCLLLRVSSVQQLFKTMEQLRITSVFLKPVCYSGAAGIVALRRNPRTGQLYVVTSTVLRNGHLYNTKRLNQMANPEAIIALLQALLPLGVMAEQWIAKDMVNGMCYDLRVVYQFGRIAHIVVRQSKGPITNLHLNNQAETVEALSLSTAQYEEIEELCTRAVSLFDGLHVVGVDVLLSRRNKKPYIIEMNGQGDLIYQDIFKENQIYKEQAAYMKRWE